jgi:REP element-mobilizing transposase RayT
MNSGASPQLALTFRTRGGRRPGAGRKPRRGGPGVSHKRRPALASRFPVHVTYRLVRRLPSARRPALFRAIRCAFNAGREAFGGRLCHFSVPKHHLHFIVEAANREALSRALQALAIRIARAINRVLGRKGKVFADCYHMRILRTPTEVRNALRSVLDNAGSTTPDAPTFLSSRMTAARSPGSTAPSWRRGPGYCRTPSAPSSSDDNVSDRRGAGGTPPARRRRRRSLRSERPRPPRPHHRPDGAITRTARRHLRAAPLAAKRPQLAQ